MMPGVGPPSSRPRQLAFGGATLLFGALAAGCFIWTLIQSARRYPDYAEACVLFDAARIRSGLPLYVDPIVGAHEYGEPPARYYVAYFPLFTALLSLMPSAAALVASRVVGLLAWYGTLAATAMTAATRHRRVALLGVLFAASVFLFNRWSASAKGDAIALALAGAALMRSLRAGRADALAGGLFALAWLFKPSVVGLGIGVIAATVVTVREHRFRAATVFALVVGSALAVLHVLSGGRAIGHLRAALGLALDGHLFVRVATSRLPFVIGLFVAGIFAAWSARRTQEGRIALTGLVASLAITVAALGKPGAGMNYLMEPALGSAVVLARFGLPRVLGGAARAVLAAAVVLSGAWSATATWRSLRDDGAIIAEEVRALARIGERCLDHPEAIVMSTEPGVEMVVNGRLYTHSLELTMETMAGRFPETSWIADVSSPNVRCVITYTGDSVPPAFPTGAFPPGVLSTMRDRFSFDRVVGPFAVYRPTGQKP